MADRSECGGERENRRKRDGLVGHDVNDRSELLADVHCDIT
jgi:hypothetical protein